MKDFGFMFFKSIFVKYPFFRRILIKILQNWCTKFFLVLLVKKLITNSIVINFLKILSFVCKLFFKTIYLK
mgnify:CR=1 FL=1